MIFVSPFLLFVPFDAFCIRYAFGSALRCPFSNIFFFSVFTYQKKKYNGERQLWKK